MFQARATPPDPGQEPGRVHQPHCKGERAMSIRILDHAGNILGTLQLPASTLLTDLEAMRRFGARRVEVIKTIGEGRP